MRTTKSPARARAPGQVISDGIGQRRAGVLVLLERRETMHHRAVAQAPQTLTHLRLPFTMLANLQQEHKVLTFHLLCHWPRWVEASRHELPRDQSEDAADELKHLILSKERGARCPRPAAAWTRPNA